MKKKKKHSLVFLFFVLFIFSHSQKPAFAFEPVLGIQAGAYPAYNSRRDQFLIVWSDCRNGIELCGSYGFHDAQDIYGQLVSGEGECLGANFPIAADPEITKSQGKQLPAVAYNPDNDEYLVVWQGHKKHFSNEKEFQDKGYDIWGQRLSGSGELLGSRFRISKLPSGNPDEDNDDSQWYPRVAYSTQDHIYMVVWHDGRARKVFPDLYSKDEGDKTTFKDIYGQIIKADGELQGENFPVTIDRSNNTHQYFGNAKRIQQYADIVYDKKQNRFLVVWEDNRLDSNHPNPHPLNQEYDRLNLDIYGGFFDSSGRPLGDNFKIAGESGDADRYPRVAYNHVFNEFMVVWQSSKAGSWGDYVKAYGQRINSKGERVGGVYLIEDQAKLHDRYYGEPNPPNVSVMADQKDGMYLISWKKDKEVFYGKWFNPSNGNFGEKIRLTDNFVDDHQLIYRDKSGVKDYFLTVSKTSPPPVFTAFKTGAMPGLKNCSSSLIKLTPTLAIPTQGSSPMPTSSSRPTSIGICHQVGQLGNPNVTWAYTSGEGIWKNIEPSRGVFVWDSLDEAIRKAKEANKKIWIQVLTDDPSGTIPQWALDAGMHQFPSDYNIDSYNKDRPVQWDPLYLTFLKEIVEAMAMRYDNNEGNNSAIEAIIIMSGGHYGEMALHGTQPIKQRYLEEMARVTGKGVEELQRPQDTSGWPAAALQIPSFDQPDILFNKYYAENVMKIIDIYARAFKNKPVVLQAGSTSMGRGDNTRYVAGNVIKYAVKTYGSHVWLKQNGWGNWEGDFYNALFGQFKTQTRIIREVGHLENMCYAPYDFYGRQGGDPGGKYTCPNASDARCCKRSSQAEALAYNTNIVNAVIEAGTSALCFQSNFFQSYGPTIFPGISNSFSDIRARLEENYRKFYSQVCSYSVKGDLDCNSLVDQIDIRILLDSWAPLGQITLPPVGYYSADLNSDGKVDEIDLTILLKNWKIN